MNSLQTECVEGERIDAFLANRLDPAGRRGFLAHLGVCKHCSSLLRDLREDERLSRIPLTPEERRHVQAIVRTVRTGLTERLEEERRRREREYEKIEPPRFAAPELVLVGLRLRRVFALAALAAGLLGAALWWFLGR